MADSEINALTELTVTPASGDWLVIDDASAIAGAPSPPATKKISVDTLLSFIDDLSQTLTNKTINSTNNSITVTASNVSDFDTEVSNNSAVVANTAKNSYPSADSTKLAGIESNATGDQTDSEIKTAYENNSDTNAFTDSNSTKLSGIETSADVTDSTNVNSAGAIMESDVSSTPAGVIIDDDTMATASATKLSTSESIKAYVDSVSASDISLKGDYNASTNSPDLDTSPSGVKKGDHYVVSVAGTFFTESLQAGDSIISKQDNPTTLAHWILTNNNLTTPITNNEISATANIALSKLATDPLARGNHTGTQLASTISDFDTEVSNNSSVTANTAKVSNATHTGDVTGSTALSIGNLKVTNAHLAGSIDNTKLLTNPLDRSNHTGTQAFSTITGTVPISQGGSGQTTAQTAIDALTQVSSATNEYVLTKDTATGNAIFKAVTSGTSSLSGLTIDTNKDWLFYSVSNQFHEAVTLGTSSKTITAESFVVGKLNVDSSGTLTVSSGGSVEIL